MYEAVCYKNSYLDQVIIRADFMEYIPEEKQEQEDTPSWTSPKGQERRAEACPSEDLDGSRSRRTLCRIWR